jgi:hypothetical protein
MSADYFDLWAEIDEVNKQYPNRTIQANGLLTALTLLGAGDDNMQTDEVQDD